MATDPAMRITPPYTPELLPSVQEAIATYLTKVQDPGLDRAVQPKVLEFGAGWSTIWFAQMGCYVVSFEHDTGWWEEVDRVKSELGYSKVAPMFFIPPEEFVLVLDIFRIPNYDLVLVDCIDEMRLPCLQGSIRLLKSGGMMVVDDSHWDILKPAFEILYGWNNYTLSGMHTRKSGETHFHQTTFFIKP